MRFELQLNRSTKHRMLPMNYQYYISAWIYRVLFAADRDFAIFLHDHGYGKSDTKLYKLFCFSKLDFGKPKLWTDKSLFEIAEHEIYLRISFDVPEAAGNFIKGLFQNQEFYLGDKFNGIDFQVRSVEALPVPSIESTMQYHLQTPWVVSFQPDGAKYPKYLQPDDEDFERLAIKHLCEKYNNTRNTQTMCADQVNMIRTSDFKKSGIVLKPGTREESKVIGSLFSFQLTAPLELHQMIFGAGISEKSSSGFGWVETVDIK